MLVVLLYGRLMNLKYSFITQFLVMFVLLMYDSILWIEKWKNTFEWLKPETIEFEIVAGS